MQAVLKYFSAKKWASSFGILLAIVSLAVAIYFFTYVKKPFYTGMAWPFGVAGFFFLIICVTVLVRTLQDLKRVNEYLQSDALKIQTEEIPRMDKIIRAYDRILIAEGVCIVAGLLLVLLLHHPFWRGVGLGLLAEAIMLLVFDWLAKSRAKEYMEFLLSVNSNAGA